MINLQYHWKTSETPSLPLEANFNDASFAELSQLYDELGVQALSAKLCSHEQLSRLADPQTMESEFNRAVLQSAPFTTFPDIETHA
jgi:hypothetical protein